MSQQVALFWFRSVSFCFKRKMRICYRKVADPIAYLPAGPTRIFSSLIQGLSGAMLEDVFYQLDNLLEGDKSCASVMKRSNERNKLEFFELMHICDAVGSYCQVAVVYFHKKDVGWMKEKVKNFMNDGELDNGICGKVFAKAKRCKILISHHHISGCKTHPLCSDEAVLQIVER